jgi:hypothetical protein
MKSEQYGAPVYVISYIIEVLSDKLFSSVLSNWVEMHYGKVSEVLKKCTRDYTYTCMFMCCYCAVPRPALDLTHPPWNGTAISLPCTLSRIRLSRQLSDIYTLTNHLRISFLSSRVSALLSWIPVKWQPNTPRWRSPVTILSLSLCFYS